MCGILGVIDSRDQIDSARFERALALLSHRGPDAMGMAQLDEGILGHTRLSILDLSASANQPFRDATKRYVLVFNGEIYNFVELRYALKQLGHRFATDSDTEVIIEAYKEWGEDCLRHFNGMFA